MVWRALQAVRKICAGSFNAELMQNMLTMMAQQHGMMRKMAGATTLKDLGVEEVKALRYEGQVHESLDYVLFKEKVQYLTEGRVDWKNAKMATTMVPTIGSMLTGAVVEWFVWSQSRITTVDDLFFHLELNLYKQTFESGSVTSFGISFQRSAEIFKILSITSDG